MSQEKYKYLLILLICVGIPTLLYLRHRQRETKPAEQVKPIKQLKLKPPQPAELQIAQSVSCQQITPITETITCTFFYPLEKNHTILVTLSGIGDDKGHVAFVQEFMVEMDKSKIIRTHDRCDDVQRKQP